MAKLAIVSGHVRTASFPSGYCVVSGTILADTHEAVVAMPSWFTTVTGSKQAITTGAVKTASFPNGFSFGQGQILAAALEVATALPGAFVTL